MWNTWRLSPAKKARVDWRKQCVEASRARHPNREYIFRGLDRCIADCMDRVLGEDNFHASFHWRARRRYLVILSADYKTLPDELDNDKRLNEHRAAPLIMVILGSLALSLWNAATADLSSAVNGLTFDAVFDARGSPSPGTASGQPSGIFWRLFFYGAQASACSRIC